MRVLAKNTVTFHSNSFPSPSLSLPNSQDAKKSKKNKFLFKKSIGSDTQLKNPDKYTKTKYINNTTIPEVTTIKTTIKPLVGTRHERPYIVNKIKLPVLFDTGSSTLLVSEDLVAKNGWKPCIVPPFIWKGAIADRTSTTTKAVHCKLLDNKTSYEFNAYVTPELQNQVIVGNSVIEHYPELLSTTNTVTNFNATTDITIGAID